MTRTEVTEYRSNLPGMPDGDVDPFLAYGQANAFVEGQFLSFKAGEWLYGMNQEVLPIGTKLAVNMAGMRVGWRRWEDRQVVDDRTSLLTDRVPLPPRQSLGDTDQAMWDKLDGRPRDPWQLTSIVEMIDGAGEKYIYATGSFGGRKCLGELCVAYGKERRLRPGQVPLVALGADTYEHKAYGRTWEPKLPIVGWAHEDTLEPVEDTPPLPPAEEATPAVTAKAADPDEPPFDVTPAPKPAPQASASPEARQATGKPAERRAPRF